MLERTGFDPTHLKLELTESLMMQDVERTIQRLHELKALSIQLVIDDFGTGYSSLAYLRRFPISVLKVDKSFVQRLGMDPQDDAIVRSIVTLASDLGMQVVAEGIETAEQLQLLRSLACDYGQGYYFSRPLPAQQAEAFVTPTAGVAEPATIRRAAGAIERHEHRIVATRTIQGACDCRELSLFVRSHDVTRNVRLRRECGGSTPAVAPSDPWMEEYPCRIAEPARS